jgi:hypothetical protein
VVFLLASSALGEGWIEPGGTAWVVALLPDLFALGVVLAYVRFLRGADELMRRVQLEGLALGFGAGFFFAMGYRLLERAGAPGLDINDASIPMLIAFFAGQTIALWRYR